MFFWNRQVLLRNAAGNELNKCRRHLVQRLLRYLCADASSSEEVVSSSKDCEKKPEKHKRPVLLGEDWCQGDLREALLELDHGNVQVDSSVYASVIRRCGDEKAFAEGKRVHAHIISSGHQTNRYVGNLLIEMYGKCGSLAEARDVFDKLLSRNVFSWNIMILAYAQNGHCEALQLFKRMQLEGVQPNNVTFISVLNACTSTSTFCQGKEIHALVLSSCLELSIPIGTALLNMCGKCGQLDDARKLFDELSSKDTISWNAMISAYAQNGHGHKALELFKAMHLEGVKPNSITFISLVDACSGLEALSEGKVIHELIIDAGYEDELVIGNCLVKMYAKCGTAEDARNIFDTMSRRDRITWNTMIAAYAQNECGEEALELFQEMLVQGPEPDKITFVGILDACANIETLEQGKLVHAQIVERGLELDVILQTALVNMYSKCGSLGDARSLFDSMSFRDVVCWNAILAAYTQNGYGKEALQLLRKMDLLGVKPNRITLMTAMDICAISADLAEGRLVHERIANGGFCWDVVSYSALINMYGKCRSLVEARKVFQDMPERNVVSWTAMIAANVDNERAKEAIELFQLMDQEGVKPNRVTFVSTIDACANVLALQRGIFLHRRAAEDGFDSDVFVGNSLINMYGKCRRLEDARSVFDKMPQRDVVSWNAVISGYAQNDEGRKALKLYREMAKEGMKPDRVTFVSVLDACACLGSLSDGKKIHEQVVESGFKSVDIVISTLVNMYGKCGSADDAKLMFDMLQRRDVISWNAVVAAYSQNGEGRKALEMLRGMDHEGVKPDGVTFISILDACADLSALAEGKKYHARAVKAGFNTDVVLGNTILNMYGKCGSLADANSVFGRMQERNMVSWNTMIVAYAQNGHIGSTVELFQEMDLEGIKPNHVSFLSILFACSHAGLLEEGQKHFHYMTGDHGIEPTSEHYGCFIDLLGRVGRLDDAEDLVRSMPIPAGHVEWMTLLGACGMHDNAEQGERAAKRVFELDPKDPAPYVKLSNIYAMGGRWRDALRIRKLLMDDRGVSTQSYTTLRNQE